MFTIDDIEATDIFEVTEAGTDYVLTDKTTGDELCRHFDPDVFDAMVTKAVSKWWDNIA
jgi:hypothetical protein